MDAQTWTMLGIILLGWGVLLLGFLWLGHRSYRIKRYRKCSVIKPDEVPSWCAAHTETGRIADELIDVLDGAASADVQENGVCVVWPDGREKFYPMPPRETVGRRERDAESRQSVIPHGRDYEDTANSATRAAEDFETRLREKFERRVLRIRSLGLGAEDTAKAIKKVRLSALREMCTKDTIVPLEGRARS